ncbi:MAG: hypothetical protein WCK82_14850 [Bacteroidota bacterium]|jgi:hypothetical protein
MKYIIRLIALPFWAIIYLTFAIYRVIVGLSKMCYGFIVHGGEQITYDNTLNRNTIFKTYLKLEEMELSLKVDPRSHCNHVWQEEVGYGQTTAPRQKCVICGVENIIKTF